MIPIPQVQKSSGTTATGDAAPSGALPTVSAPAQYRVPFGSNQVGAEKAKLPLMAAPVGTIAKAAPVAAAPPAVADKSSANAERAERRSFFGRAWDFGSGMVKFIWSDSGNYPYPREESFGAKAAWAAEWAVGIVFGVIATPFAFLFGFVVGPFI